MTGQRIGDVAKGNGSDLVSIESEKEWSFLKNTIQKIKIGTQWVLVSAAIGIVLKIVFA